MAIRKYRVKEGFTYGAHDEHVAGAIIELEENEAIHVMDKLELAEVSQNVPDGSVEMESNQMTADSTDSRSNSPETVEKEDDDPKTGKSSTLRSKKKSGD
jgi:hypothetical protein